MPLYFARKIFQRPAPLLAPAFVGGIIPVRTKNSTFQSDINRVTDSLPATIKNISGGTASLKFGLLPPDIRQKTGKPGQYQLDLIAESIFWTKFKDRGVG
jgi:hypothetical protein